MISSTRWERPRDASGVNSPGRDNPVQRGAGVRCPAHALVDVDLDGSPPARLREPTEGVELEADVSAVAGGGHAGVEGGADGLHPRSTWDRGDLIPPRGSRPGIRARGYVDAGGRSGDGAQTG